MLTQMTLLAVRELYDKLGQAEQTRNYLTRADVVENLQAVISDEQLATITATLQAPVTALREALVAALRNLQVDFAPVEQQTEAFEDGLRLPLATALNLISGSEGEQLSARVALSHLFRRAQTWLQEQELGALPGRRYLVRSRFGDFEIVEKTEHRARARACEVHYGRPYAQMDHNVLRDFAVGVLIP